MEKVFYSYRLVNGLNNVIFFESGVCVSDLLSKSDDELLGIILEYTKGGYVYGGELCY